MGKKRTSTVRAVEQSDTSESPSPEGASSGASPTGGEAPPSEEGAAAKRPYVDIDGLYTRALDAESPDAVLGVTAGEVRHLVESLLIVVAQKREVGRAVAEAIQIAADQPLKGLDLDAVLRRVREGNQGP